MRWDEFLTTIAWIGPFVFAVMFLPLEKWFPRLRLAKQAHVRIIIIFCVGVTTLISLFLFSVFFQEYIVEAVYRVHLFDFAKLPIPIWLNFFLCFVLIDFATYIIHFSEHKLSFLWRLHRVHHADLSVTSSTGLLHHPLETILTFVFLLSIYVIFGIPVVVIIVYGAITAFHSILTHSNIRYPKILNSYLKYLIITPDIHRTHHSIVPREGNSNFGQILSVWDHLFGTFIERPKNGFTAIKMGLPDGGNKIQWSFKSLIFMPFSKNK